MNASKQMSDLLWDYFDKHFDVLLGEDLRAEQHMEQLYYAQDDHEKLEDLVPDEHHFGGYEITRLIRMWADNEKLPSLKEIQEYLSGITDMQFEIGAAGKEQGKIIIGEKQILFSRLSDTLPEIADQLYTKGKSNQCHGLAIKACKLIDDSFGIPMNLVTSKVCMGYRDDIRMSHSYIETDTKQGEELILDFEANIIYNKSGFDLIKNPKVHSKIPTTTIKQDMENLKNLEIGISGNLDYRTYLIFRDEIINELEQISKTLGDEKITPSRLFADFAYCIDPGVIMQYTSKNYDEIVANKISVVPNPKKVRLVFDDCKNHYKQLGGKPQEQIST
jgi:hypothetical protein